MPPHLRHGKAVQQRRFVLPQAMVICQCSECNQQRFFDLDTFDVLPGQRITPRLHRQHRNEDARKAAAAAHLERPINSEATFYPVHGPAPTIIQPTSSSKSKQKSFPAKSVVTLTSQLKSLSQSLAAITTSSFRDGFGRHPPTFLNPPRGDASESCDLTLEPTSPTNYAFLQHERALRSTSEYLDEISRRNLSRIEAIHISKLRNTVDFELKEALAVKQEEWNLQQQSRKLDVKHVDTDRYFKTLEDWEPITCIAALLAGTLYFLSNLSLDHLGFCLPTIALIVQVALAKSLHPENVQILNSLPNDMRTIIGKLNVEPVFKTVICCPGCFATYGYTQDDILNTCPEFCTSKYSPEARTCGQRLFKRRLQLPPTPTREFTYQDLHHWVARLYSRSDIEGLLDNDPTAHRGYKSHDTEDKEDIWDGEILQNFKGPDDRPFLVKPKQEGRLVFGLNMDGFNPNGSKEGGKSLSICGIYMVCLNLPPHIRYRVENVFLLGVVPGPHEPSTHQVNEILRPLVDQLLLLWHSGVYLSRTTKYPHGRLVRAALVPIICDLPAARRVAGLGGHAAGYFCSECLQTQDQINNLDSSTWTRRSLTEHLRHANLWLNAETDAERTTVFQQYGAKWSELLRLPYWDPTRFIVIDSMHGFYLRLFHRHIRDIWGMNIKFTDGDGTPDFTANVSEETLAEAQTMLRVGDFSALERLRRVDLQYLCRDIGLHYGGRKRMLLETLRNYRIEQGWENPETPASFGANLDVPSDLPDGHGSLESAAHGDLISPVVVVDSVEASTSKATIPTMDVDAEAPAPDLSTSADTELLRLYMGGKTALNRARKDRLKQLAVFIGGGEPDDYNNASKKDLQEYIFAFRSQDSMTTPVVSTQQCMAQGPSIQPEGGMIPPATTTQALPALGTTPQILSDLYRHGTKTTLKNTRKRLLAVLCALKLKGDHDYLTMKKDQLLEFLHESRLADGIVGEDGALLDTGVSSKAHVLGKDTLREIQNDMNRIGLPSWFDRAPAHPGEVQWGRFKASEWKAFCTVNLPFTLTRLWGNKPETSRHRQMLTNFMHLVTAVKIANKRTISSGDITSFEYHLRLYLVGFLELYPFANISPYQHLALHFSDHLKRWGPTHAWRCFAFERYNGVLQSLPDNNKFNQLERTKFTRFCRAQNLRHQFSVQILPDEAQSIIPLFERTFQTNVLFASTASPHETINITKERNASALLRHEVAALRKCFLLHALPSHSFIPTIAQQLTQVEFHGRNYRVGPSTSSHVLFRPNRRSDESFAGQLVKLVSYGDDIYAITRRFDTLPTELLDRDTFRLLPPAAGYLVLNRLGVSLYAIPFDCVHGHFAATPHYVEGIEAQCLHVIALD